jgi:hypothetical protein
MHCPNYNKRLWYIKNLLKSKNLNNYSTVPMPIKIKIKQGFGNFNKKPTYSRLNCFSCSSVLPF